MGYTKRKITIWQRIKCLFGMHVFAHLFEHGDRKDRRLMMCKHCPKIKDVVVPCEHDFVPHYQLGRPVVVKCRHCPETKM